MKTLYTHREDAPLNDPSLRPTPCGICGVTVPLRSAHSVALVYVGYDAQGRVRYTECDADQPFGCSHEHALAAALAYHQQGGAAARAAWHTSEPTHSPLPLPHPEEDACHQCGGARAADHVTVYIDYRCTGDEQLPAWNCPHILCPDCLDGGIETCLREHLPAQLAHHHTHHPKHRVPDPVASVAPPAVSPQRSSPRYSRFRQTVSGFT